MSIIHSPLRYPGGKGSLSSYLASLIDVNDISSCIYVEPFAGGAGSAIKLLLGGKVDRIILNDADRSIYSFWKSIIKASDKFIDKIHRTPVTMASWQVQRNTYYNAQSASEFDLGFAAFFLNRCNRSGIIANGGVIGGLQQTGEWKIDARFNKDALVKRISEIAAYRDNIDVYNLDALKFLRKTILIHQNRDEYLVYLDPPYYVKGSRLYLNYYNHQDHANLARFLRKIKGLRWLASYDNVPEIRSMYEWCDSFDFVLGYSANKVKLGSEIMFFSEGFISTNPEILSRCA